MTNLETVVIDLIQHCRARCGSGFGSYPVGVRYAISELLPLVDQNVHGRNGQTITEQVRELDERLAR